VSGYGRPTELVSRIGAVGDRPGGGAAWIATVAGVCVLAIGLLVLGGWTFDWPWVIVWTSGDRPMWPLTAIMLVLGASALLILGRGEPGPVAARIAGGIAVVVALAAAAVLIESILVLDLGIESALFPDTAALRDARWPGRPAGMTSVSLLAIAIALWLHTSGFTRRYMLAHLLAAVAALGTVHSLFLFTYDFGNRAAHDIPLNTALAVFILAVGIVFVRPDRGLMVPITATDLGGRLARRLLPAAVCLPFVLGLIFVIAVTSLSLSEVHGFAAVILVMMAGFVAMVWRHAAVLHDLEARREEARAEREAALQTARAERAYLQSVIDNLPVAVVIAEAPTGRLVMHNRQFDRVTGPQYRVASSTQEYQVHRLFHVDGRPYEPREMPLTRAIRDGESIEGEEIEYDRFDELRGIMRVSARPIRSESGEVIAAVAVMIDVTEERRMAREREDVAARLRLALSASRMGTWEWDLASDRILWSPELEVIHGMAPGTYPGTFDAFCDTVHPDDRDRVITAVHDALIRRSPYHVIYRAILPDNAARRFEAWGRVFSTPAGYPERMVGICWDVTERESARAIEASLATIVSSSPDAIIGKDFDGTITSWNRGAERMYGYSAEEVIGKSSTILMPPDRESDVEMIMAELRRGRAVENFRTEHVTRDGRRLAVSITVSPVRDAENRIVGAAAIARDETERVRAEQERERILERERSLRERVTGILESMVDGFVALDTEFRITYINPAAAELVARFLDRQSSELVGRVLWECIPGLKGTDFDGALRRAMQARESVVIESFLESVDAWMELRAAPTPDGLAVFVRDVTERHVAEQEREALLVREQEARAEAERRREELQQVLESRERLMRGFSHDVKNPLGAADGQLYLLEEGVPDRLEPRPHERVVRARHSIRAALRVIESLVELAKAESAQLQFEYSPLDVVAMVRDATEEYRGACAAKGLSISVAADPNVQPIVTDGDRARQVLGNLLANAVKYTDEGEIRVRVAAVGEGDAQWPGEWVRIDVEDTGPGVPAEKHDEIFTEFTRLSTHTADRGAGLGLAIARRLAQLLGGDITLESEPGRGSTFTLWLPRLSVDAPDDWRSEVRVRVPVNAESRR